MRILIGSIFLYLIIATGCHSARRIDMRNLTDDSVQIIWTLNEDSLANNPFMISNSKELKFVLHSPKTARINMSFGAGNWSPTEVQKLVNRLASLEIISASQRIKIDSLPLLKDYLLARRKGIGGARIEITVSQ